MTSSQDFRRPDDVSREEARRLLELFDLCLTAERDNSSDDELSFSFTSALEKLNLDAKTEQAFLELFFQASNGEFYDEEYRRLEFLLQRVAVKDLSNEEHAELRRLEFMLALALPPRKSPSSIGGGLPGGLVGALPGSFLGMLIDAGAAALNILNSPDDDESNGPIAQFKERVLWDVLGDARPRTTTEFLRVLRDRGIILRHSP